MLSFRAAPRQIPLLPLAILLTVGQTFALSTLSSTVQDQKQISITVYNSNLALVRDVRRMRLPEGTFNLRFLDVAAHINPATVHLVSLTYPEALTAEEQRFNYDLLTPQALLAKYAGKEVTIVRVVNGQQSSKQVSVKATLLADNHGLVWKIGNEIVTGLVGNRYVFPSLPPNLYTKPTLTWLLDNRSPGEQSVEVAYLTTDMNWSANYTLTIGKDQKSATLEGWVTIVNNSGTSFRKSLLQLVAGEPHRVHEAPKVMKRAMEMRTAAAPQTTQFSQERVAEYHLYTLNRPTDLENNETKQISLLSATKLRIEKQFEVNGQQYYFRSPITRGEPVNEPVQVGIKFKNSKSNSLGMPLPAGVVRAYQADSQGRLQFIGEDRINHTPKDETLSLDVGNAFDVVAKRLQTEYNVIGHSYETGFAVTLRNHKSEAIVVEVNEPFGGEWKILDSNFDWKKTSAFSARFTVPVAANGQAVLKYRVLVTLR